MLQWVTRASGGEEGEGVGLTEVNERVRGELVLGWVGWIGLRG